MADFYKIGFLLLQKNKLLFCRKNHFTSKLILPGGRIEQNESDRECLCRELIEELGDVSPQNLSFIGQYEDFAHCDDPTIKKTLVMKVYQGDLMGNPKPHSEIIELVWFGPDDDLEQLTPIFRNKVLPDLIQRGILNWDSHETN